MAHTSHNKAAAVDPSLPPNEGEKDSFTARSAVVLGELANRIRLAACSRVGKNVTVHGTPVIRNRGYIELGNEVVLQSSGAPIRLFAGTRGEIVIGEGTRLEAGVAISAQHAVTLGQRVTVGPYVSIADDTDDETAEPDKPRTIEIGDDVLLEPRAQIHAGAKIGRGATILAGAQVSGRVEAGEVFPAAPPSGVVDRSRADSEVVSATFTSVSAKPVLVTPTHTPRGVILADFTADDLAAQLSKPSFDGIGLQTQVAPYGQIVQELLALSVLAEGKPDFAVVWSLPELVSPAFRLRVEGESQPISSMLRDVSEFANQIKAHAHAARFIFVPSFVCPSHQRGLGVLDLRSDGLSAALLRMNLCLLEALADVPNVFVLDAQRWLSSVGEAGTNPKLWYLGKVPFAPEVFECAANDLRASMRAALGLSRKLVVLDLDETLWGGIVGDVGWEELRLGGHDAEGEAFVDFQRHLLALSRRGIALAVVSKNEENVALEAMRQHPEMILRPEHIAAYRINWHDKAQNIAEIAQELNLGLASIVFIDDNPVERGRVREALPDVHVPEWPIDPTLYVKALEELACFDSVALSEEDGVRSRMYGVERERNALKGNVSSFDDWLKALNIRVAFERLHGSNLSRTTQLLNKTNQMNLRTRRLSETELSAWAESAEREVWTIRVADRFGDAGLTGILSLERRGNDVFVEDYVLSCRVMGRRVEEALAWAAVERAKRLGGQQLIVTPIPTKKNKPCLDFWERTPLKKQDQTHSWPVSDFLAPPEHVAILGLEDT